jgi:hypothetical protein
MPESLAISGTFTKFGSRQPARANPGRLGFDEDDALRLAVHDAVGFTPTAVAGLVVETAEKIVVFSATFERTAATSSWLE